MAAQDATDKAAAFDFIIVGSGAGGGPLACNLARQKFRVLLIEAGGRDIPKTAEVPLLHGQAAEDPSVSGEFFVRHYACDTRSRLDAKWCEERHGILYPRASAIGG